MTRNNSQSPGRSKGRFRDESRLVTLARTSLRKLAAKARKASSRPNAPFYLELHGDFGPTFRGTPLFRPELPDDLSPDLKPGDTLFVGRDDGKMRAGPVWASGACVEVVFGDDVGGRGWRSFEDLASRAAEPASLVPWPGCGTPSRTHLANGRGWLSFLSRFGQDSTIEGIVARKVVMPVMHPDRIDRIRRVPGLYKTMAIASAQRKLPPWWVVVETDLFTCMALMLDFLAEFRPAPAIHNRSADGSDRAQVALQRPIPICEAEKQLNKRNLHRTLRHAKACMDEAANPMTVELADLCRSFPRFKQGLVKWANERFPKD